MTRIPHAERLIGAMTPPRIRPSDRRADERAGMGFAAVVAVVFAAVPILILWVVT